MIYKYLFVWAPKHLTIYKITFGKLFYIPCNNKIISGLELDHLSCIKRQGKYSYLVLDEIDNISAEVTKKEYFVEQKIKFGGIISCCINAADVQMTKLNETDWEVVDELYFDSRTKEELSIVLLYGMLGEPPFQPTPEPL